MGRSYPYAVRVAVVAVGIGFTICVSAAAPSALTAAGDGSLEARRYAAAEVAYAEALQLAEQQGERDGERALIALMGLGKARAEAGHHEEAIPALQRARSDQTSSQIARARHFPRNKCEPRPH